MRLVLLLPALFLLSACGDVTAYNPLKNESPSSLAGSEGGGGVQTDIWSSNPSQKTLTSNQNNPYGP